MYHDKVANTDGHAVQRWKYTAKESQAVCVAAMRDTLTELGSVTPTTLPPGITLGRLADALVAAVNADHDVILAEMGGKNTSNYELKGAGVLWTRQWRAAARAVIKLLTDQP